jgi:hypothetical protein
MEIIVKDYVDFALEGQAQVGSVEAKRNKAAFIMMDSRLAGFRDAALQLVLDLRHLSKFAEAPFNVEETLSIAPAEYEIWVGLRKEDHNVRILSIKMSAETGKIKITGAQKKTLKARGWFGLGKLDFNRVRRQLDKATPSLARAIGASDFVMFTPS